ncbi:MAG TPA: autoinducer binding domain-containing protein [Janthinobacterium sp.]|jgi:LuxR family transcriptional regulator|nr:autoinducer binding domain-containing protein [Janthinobacterium sp.]
MAILQPFKRKGSMSDLRTIDWQEIQFEAISAVKNEAALLSVLTGAAIELGFDYCAYGMRLPLPFSNPKTVMLNNYPLAWQERYAKENYLAVDPTVAHALTSLKPLLWSDELFAPCRPLWEDARAHRLQVGWAQASHDVRGVAGLLTLARSHDVISAAELRQNLIKMSWLAQAAHAGLARLISSKPQADAAIVLTAREIEVLRWTADGKTSGEVGDILNISERTVNFHVNNSLAKLGSVNKTAGVLKAAMLRLL